MDDVDFAEALDRTKRDEAVYAVRQRLDGEGSDDCESCGKPIPSVRRKALPSATRCVPCQSRKERARRA